MEKPTPHRRLPRLRSAPLSVRLALVAIVAGGGAVTAYSLVPPEDLAILRAVESPTFQVGGEFQHQDQAALNTQAMAVQNAAQRVALLTAAFDHGDELFEFNFSAQDGGGAFVSSRQRYTRFPRGDLKEGGWFSHSPGRATGPNSGACFDCHSSLGIPDGAGAANSNVHRDPFRTGIPENYIQRNTPHVHGAAGKQRLGEEMTQDLLAIRNATPGCNCGSSSRANPPCGPQRRPLLTKGIDFGTAIVSRNPGATACKVQILPPTGFTTKAVSDDLVVRPFQWKGSVAFIRDFARGAMHNELGMQGDEFFDRPDVDGDRDGVSGELSVGDLTTLSVYIAAQPRPTSRLELDSLRAANPVVAGLVPALPVAEAASIRRGLLAFRAAQCNACHVESLTVNDRLFREPSQVAEHRDRLLPGGRLPGELGLDFRVPLTFDITTDQPDNKFNVVQAGQVTTPLGSFRRQGQAAVVELYSDLRRHDLGELLEEPVDEVGTGKSVFITTPLWGLASSAPYLHDGRAVTVTEAVLFHKGEAAESRRLFVAMPVAQQRDLVAFLNNLVLFLPELPEAD